MESLICLSWNMHPLLNQASLPSATHVREPGIHFGDAKCIRIERPAEPVAQLAPGARHQAGERTQQIRVAWRAATVFRRACAPSSDAAWMPDAWRGLHLRLDLDR